MATPFGQFIVIMVLLKKLTLVPLKQPVAGEASIIRLKYCFFNLDLWQSMF
ncbi:hypothetical protein [Acinetobacter sp. WZC-1]|uniref:hypothetical protein n=1 Tax=Acinetobacter sp. WZC-1 TaxID=3459034 RepID=UPI00403DF0D2